MVDCLTGISRGRTTTLRFSVISPPPWCSRTMFHLSRLDWFCRTQFCISGDRMPVLIFPPGFAMRIHSVG